MSLDAHQKYEHYTALAEQLDAAAATGSTAAVLPYAGGISESDKDSYEADSDRVQPYFRKVRIGENGPADDEDDWP